MASIDLLLAGWVLNELAPESVPGLAVDALSDGCEAPEVAIFAGLVRPTRLDVEEELPALLRRLGSVCRPRE